MARYSVDDLIGKCIPSKKLRCGWKVEITKSGRISLSYTPLSFDFHEVEGLDDERFAKLMASPSYLVIKGKLDAMLRKIGRTYFDGYSIGYLKWCVEGYGLDIDVDRLVNSAIRKKSEAIRKVNRKLGRKCSRKKRNRENNYNLRKGGN